VSGALILPFDDVEPTVHPDAWLAPTATVIGHATIDSRASVFYGAVVRADMDRVALGAGSNLQDNVVVLEGTVVPPRSLVAGVPGKVRRPLSDAEYDRVVANAQIYLHLAARHRQTTG